jgi:hypothetical protein
MSRASASPVKIIVDVHEWQSGIAETLRELGADVEIAALPAVDYAVAADTLVERKWVLDLHAAVLKGRLWPQLGKLRAACAFPYLLVEGTDIYRGPLHHNAVRGACLAVIDQGIALLRSGCKRDSALDPPARRSLPASRAGGRPPRLCTAASAGSWRRNSRGGTCCGSRDLDSVGPRAPRAVRERGWGRLRRSGRLAQRAGHRSRARSRSRRDVHTASQRSQGS